jgi:hypothetical protein
MEVYAQIQRERAARQERRAKRLEHEARVERVLGPIKFVFMVMLGTAWLFAMMLAVALCS